MGGGKLEEVIGAPPVKKTTQNQTQTPAGAKKPRPPFLYIRLPFYL
jgi:hypothetical protein